MDTVLTTELPGEWIQLTLNRPDKANALNLPMIESLLQAFEHLSSTYAGARGVLLRGAGRHFCGGADVTWMQASLALSPEANLAETKRLQSLFQSLADVPIPTIALVQGAVYGGGVGLVAACDYGFGLPHTKFCLSEVKLGLLPAVILPYVAQKISQAACMRLALSAQVFHGLEAQSIGLLSHCVEDLDQGWGSEKKALEAGGPLAQRAFKALYRQVRTHPLNAPHLCAEAIAQARLSPEAQQRLRLFLKIP